MNKNNQEQEDGELITQPDHDDPDMEYVQTVSTEEFNQRIEQQESEQES